MAASFLRWFLTRREGKPLRSPGRHFQSHPIQRNSLRFRPDPYIKLPLGCGGKPARTVGNQNRMTTTSIFSDHAARLRLFMAQSLADPELPAAVLDETFEQLALKWFALQFQHNAAYQVWCKSRGASLETVAHWADIPALPTSAFKELDVTSISVAERTQVFHSSGTTEQRPSRHFHHAASLALYETSLLLWFRWCLLAEAKQKVHFLILTPPASSAPHSSLVHMFDAVRREFGAARSKFYGALEASAAWSLNEAELQTALQSAMEAAQPVMLLGTAFSYVHLVDQLVAEGKTYHLPPGSCALETGGYKGRSRSLPKSELHQLIGERLGLAAEQIVCEYGMSELSSQAYDAGPAGAENSARLARHFQFPPWARVCIVSPETGREVQDGETGLVRVLDLANLWSVAAVQTEDLAIRRGSGFELLGRTAVAEARGCSLMSANR